MILKAYEEVEMYAVVEAGGKQYKISPGDMVTVEKLPGEAGSQVVLAKVLMVSDDGIVKVGQPLLDGAKVVAEIMAQERGPKITVFKFKRRKKYRRKQGHRQALTRIRIKEIIV